LIGLICDTRSNPWLVLLAEFKGEYTFLVTQYEVKGTSDVSPTVIHLGRISFLIAYSLQELNF